MKNYRKWKESSACMINITICELFNPCDSFFTGYSFIWIQFFVLLFNFEQMKVSKDLSYKELRQLAKKHGIKANQKKVTIIQKLNKAKRIAKKKQKEHKKVTENAPTPP